MDFAAAGLLDGLEGKEREAREQLLERLASDGFTLDELKQAVAEERLALLPVERVLGGNWSSRQIAEKTDLPLELLLRLRRLLGLPETDPDDEIFGDEWIEAAKSTKVFLDAGLGDQAIADISRVLGEAMARVAATTTGAFAEAFLQAGDSEEDVAERFARLAEQLTPSFGPVLLAAFKGHLREAVERGVISRAELASGHLEGEQQTTVCFADLVGFTTLGGQLAAEELGTVITSFGELAADVADSQVRLIKTIGDAAMLSCRTPAPLVAAALSLLEAVDEADLPGLRAGVACGPAVERGGDLYGHAVNLASRVTAIARPESVLCTKEVRDAAPDDFDWSFAGKHRVKGIDKSIPLYRARRLDAAAAEGESSSRRKSGRRQKQASS
ncbi:MAG TPA: adenylate cyclase regulatory domain-containing protein [Solirubrobacteraceae bacterium]|nr:adenylate cyclase regulatory domain-containing protein [Solirubrobacteraceae bacterium]